LTWAIFVIMSHVGFLDAQDQITVRDPRTGKTSRFEARVMAWDASRLVYSGNGRESSLPASRVVDVVYARTAAQSEADEQFQAGRFLQAWQAYENAIADEPREWVKVEIMARQLRCAAALGRQRDALRSFFAIQQATPRSRYFHLIPLAWDRSRPDAALAGLYRTWLDSQDELQRLLAGSWMLLVDESAATAALRPLSQSADARVAHLATAQLWRPRTVAADENEIQRWETAVSRMPEPLQAGPRFLVALARKPPGQESDPARFDRTVVALLQIPILFPEQYQLCGTALREATGMLAAAGREEEAAIVRSELRRDYAFSAAAISEGGRVETINQ
jgi:hypothetical protein